MTANPGQTFPAGTLRGDDAGVVHIIDGDDAPLCEHSDPDSLVRVDHYNWPDIHADNRCSYCAARLLAYAGPA